MSESFWQGTAVGLLVGVLGSLAAFRAPLAVLTQLAKDTKETLGKHDERISDLELTHDRVLHMAGLLRTRKTDHSTTATAK